jgi:maltooligosyltrehalose trehalohydrolase
MSDASSEAPTIRVWAPAATSVELVPAGTRPADAEPRPMVPTEGGWWVGTWGDIGAGDDYRFSLDGGPPLPDPRSAWQPLGVHGPSRLVDHRAFRWSDHDWRPGRLADGLVYELHVGTYSPEGTFDGVAARLDHLVDLGVTHLELMPVNAFPGIHGWGYDGVALFAPHDPYGGPDGLKRLIDACHGRGLAVIIDVVYNHFGPDGNYTAAFGPYQTDRYRTPWGPAVNLDGPGSDEVRRFFIDNAVGWLRDYHADGLRLDAVHAFVDRSAIPMLEELADEVHALAGRTERDLVLIAESDQNDPRLLRPPSAGGYGLDAAWNDDFHHALHVALTRERTGYYEDFVGLPDIVRALTDIYVYSGRFSVHRNRRHGRPAADLRPDRFIGYSQNHDQVGNRAAGERLSHIAGVDAARVAAAIVLTGPFVPLLFQGEEWAASTPFQYMADHRDPELARAVSLGRRREFEAFGWPPDAVPDPQDPATLDRSRLDWTELDRAPHAAMLDWYRELIALRRAIPALRNGERPGVRAELGAGWIAIDRPGVSLVANLGPAPVIVPWPERASPGPRELALASGDGVTPTDDGIALAPCRAAVVTG